MHVHCANWTSYHGARFAPVPIVTSFHSYCMQWTMCKLCTLKIEFCKLSPLCMQLYFMHNMSQTSWWYRLQNCDALFSRGFKFVKTQILHFWCTAFHSLHSFSVWTPWKAPPFLSWRQCDPLEGMSSVFCHRHHHHYQHHHHHQHHHHYHHYHPTLLSWQHCNPLEGLSSVIIILYWYLYDTNNVDFDWTWFILI